MYALILAGGSGTRLWPLSRENFPKYHLSVFPHKPETLFEQTFFRLNGFIEDKNIIIITSQSQKGDIETVLKRNKKDEVRVIGEPLAKNTAPAIGLAAWYLNKKDPDAIMAVLPSDHYLEPAEEFIKLLKNAESSVGKYGLITFGIMPDAPETGYGYILTGEKIDNYSFRVEKFVEKPDDKTAEKFLKDDRYLWNSGMFAFKVSSLMADFRKYLPETASLLDKLDVDNFSNLSEIYENMGSISIDYGIMEKSDQVAVIPTSIKWNDVGSWNSFYQMSEKDKNNNFLQGKVIDIDTSDSLIISSSRITGAIGLKNLIVVDTPDALLLCDREKTQDVKKIVEKLKEDNSEEAYTHKTVYRPWGSFTVLTEEEGFKVKTITVNLGQRLSLQKHRFRSENWTVVNGTAKVTLDEDIHLLSPGNSIYIPAGSLHRLQNEGNEIVEIVEVQTGTYLGEDDIERISDDYNRAGDNSGNIKSTDNTYMEKFNNWLHYPGLDEKTQEELKIISEDDEEIKKRFSQDLEFGTGGLRGVIGAGTNRINSFVIRRTTQGLANYINEKYKNDHEKKAVIAYDSRHFSKEFAEDTALVFAANKIKTYLFSELRPTPELSFAIRKLNAHAGVVITASHNPPQYNGYKVYNQDGGQAVPSETEEIIKYIDKVDIFDNVKYIEKNEATDKELLIYIKEEIDTAYLEKVKSLCDFKGNKEIKVVYSPLHGTGYPLIPRALKELGYKNIFLVDEQVDPDPDFSTVKSPNPEERDAFSMALKLAEKERADIVLGTDPDGDRTGCAVKNKNDGYILLNGNQVGALLVNYLLSRMQEEKKLPDNGIVVKTIVTGNLGKIIAEDFGIDTTETLTGFKFIGEKINEFEKSGAKKFIFGYEESFGYLAGTFVRDKDAVISSVLITEMAAYYLEKGLTLLDVLDSLYQKYGYFFEELQSIELTDPSSAEKTVIRIAEKNLPEIAGLKVTEKRNYMTGKSINPQTLTEKNIDLPKTAAILFHLEDDSWFCVRPSGTEPRFKIYYSATGKTENEALKNLENLKKEVQVLVS